MSADDGWGSRRRYLVGERLRLRRRELGLTQQQLASRLAAAGVPVTNKALSSLERGVGLDVAKLPELAQALDCSVTFLLGLTDDPRRWDPDVQPSSHGVRALEPTAVAAGNHPSVLGPDVPDLRVR